ncbi:MAG: hypothetical protein J3K34DRAFT_496093 [Monoraphidium minutum]|nr:MAG: hypothetical protein J3K34DRAFT_496093 [Monoraphidium minutum]
MPRFVHVEHLAGSDGGGQEDVQIEHVEADEARRQAEVDAGIIQQVDGLVAYFNGLYDEDRAAINELEGEVAAKDEVIAALQQQAHIQQQHRHHHHSHHQQQKPGLGDTGHGLASGGARMSASGARMSGTGARMSGTGAPLLSAGERRPSEVGGGSGGGGGGWISLLWGGKSRPSGAWTLCALLVVALFAVVVGLAAGLAAKSRQAAGAAASAVLPVPHFSYVPQLLAPGDLTINLQLALTSAGTVHFVVVPAGQEAGGKLDRGGVMAASQGLLSGSALENVSTACGQVPVPLPGRNLTLSIASAHDTPECSANTEYLAAAGSARASCARCPRLAPSTLYSVLLVTSAGAGQLGDIAVVQAPMGASPRANISVVDPSAEAAGAGAFRLRFTLDAPGTLRFAVLYSAMAARFGDTYVTFGNAPADAAALLASDLAGFSGGVVARGSCTVAAANVATQCRIGPLREGDAAGASECQPEGVATCEVSNACFGVLCDYSRFGIVGSTNYQPSAGLRVSPLVGPDRFSVEGVGQERPGLAYVIVTRHSNQRLQAVAFVSCVAVERISEVEAVQVPLLDDATLYSVQLVTSDTAGNQGAWSALVHTQDLTPPDLRVVTPVPPPSFTAFTVPLELDEPATIYAALVLAADAAAAAAAQPACPPSFQKQLATGPALRATFNFTKGVAPNTDYVVLFIAVDAYGNCQRAFTQHALHTADNVPPITLGLGVANVTGATAQLQLQLDEPGTAFYAVYAATAADPPACPSAEYLFAITAAAAPHADAGSFPITSRAPAVAEHLVSGLESETAYVTCVVAQDSTQQHNRQTAVRRVAFTTLDVTPPALNVSLVAASAGGDISCSPAPPYLCNATWQARLSEPGRARWVLLRTNDSTTPLAGLPSPAELWSLPLAQALGPLAASVVDGASAAPLVFPPSPAAHVNHTGLACDAAYALLLAPHDNALPAPNMPAALTVLRLVAPDVQPPGFLGYRLSGATDAALAFSATLDEASTVAYVLKPCPSDAPSVDEAFSVEGLQPGQRYDLHMAAVDYAGNRQPNTTTVSCVRTTDSRPPAILELIATWTPPMSLTLAVNASKPGTLRFVARRAGAPPPASAQEVLDDVAANSLAANNFTSSAAIPLGYTLATATLCVADGADMIVYGVAQDREGDFTGRSPNTSPLMSAPVTLVAPVEDTSCSPAQFLAPLHPTLGFDPLGPGFAVGGISAAVDPDTGATAWTQTAAAFMRQSPVQPARVLPRAGALALDGGITFNVQPRPPSRVSAVVVSQTLTDDGSAGGSPSPGRTLRLSFQLKDALGRTAVDTSGAALHPLLAYAGTPPSGLNNSTQELPRNSAVATSHPSPLEMAAVTPPYAPFAPAAPGILAVLPAWPLHTGQVFTAALVAANPLGQGLTGWSIALRYNHLQLQLVNVLHSGLWQRPLQSTAGQVGVVTTQTLTSPGRAGGQPPERYRASSSIPLAELTFVVRAAEAGPCPGAISFGAGTALIPSAGVVPSVAFYDHRGGAQEDGGSILVAATRSVGLWAWAERSDVFNTARFTGARVATRLLVAEVRSWLPPGAPAAAPVAAPSCSKASGGDAGVLWLDAPACTVYVGSDHALPAKDFAFRLSSSDAAGAPSASTTLSVWQPSNATVETEDATLNSVLPLNAAAPSAGCADRYQATRLRARADWSNGGAAPGDTITGADITALAGFVSNNSAVVAVQGSTARGVAAGAAVVGLAGSAPAAAPAALTVSNTPVCLVALEPLATTGVEFVAGATPPAPRPGMAAALSWRGAQRLEWEGAAAHVLSYARFSDGATMDVSDRALLALGLPPGTPAPLPFALGADAGGAPLLSVNTSASGDGPVRRCGAYLSASWEVCSLPLGSGRGRVVLGLPQPSGIAQLAASPPVIAAAGDPAALPPIARPTRSALSLAVAFSDGMLRDFSADARTSFAVSAGSTLCSVARDNATGAWSVTAVPGAAGGAPGEGCTLAARVAFAGAAAPLGATVTVGVESLRAMLLYALPPSTAALPAAPPAGSPLGPTLRLLRCDSRNFDQVTVWGLAVLSNCTGAPSACPMTDVNSRAWLGLNSSDPAVLSVARPYPVDPDVTPAIDNRLLPATPGAATLSLAFGDAVSRLAVSVEDTYQPTWPRAGGATDTSLEVTANMTGEYEVLFRAVPTASLDLAGDPPSAAAIVAAGAVALAADPARGPHFYAATAAGLAPGSDYTLLLVVRSGLTLSSGVTALTGALVPDTTPPSFTAAALASGAAATAVPQSGTLSFDLALGLDEAGTVSYALYGDPACITDDPTEVELKAGATLPPGKCSCSAAYCAALKRGSLSFRAGALADTVSVTAPLPANPYAPLRYPDAYASRSLTLYLLAEDNAPTYKGWASACAAPAYNTSGPPGPCDPVTPMPCTNTPPALEDNNRQAPPFAGPWDPTLRGSSAPQPPPRRPLRAQLAVADGAGVEFSEAALAAVGGGGQHALVFSFRVTRASLVRWYLVRDVVHVLAWGMLPVFDAAAAHNVTISRDCDGALLAPGTNYGLWHNASDVYGSYSPLRMISHVL